MTSTLTARVLPYLPGTLIGGNGIDVIQAGTVFTIQWNPTEAGFSTFGLQLGGAPNAAAASALINSPLSWRNIIGANGGFEVWQRGAGASASFTVNASTTSYTADRWYLTTAANEQCTVAAVAGIVNGSRIAAKVTRNSGQTGTSLLIFGFPLDTDEIAMITGQFVAVSFTAKAGANWSAAGGLLSVLVEVGTGAPVRFTAGYTAAATVIAQNVALTTTPTRFTFISPAVVPLTATQAEVLFDWMPVGTAGADDSFTVDDVQLEIGSPTVFERVPFEKMLQGCKRHYWKTFLYGTVPAQNVGIGTGELYAVASNAGASNVNRIHTRFPVSMRISPSVATFNPASASTQARDEVANADTSVLSSSGTAENWQASFTGAAGTVAGNLIGLHMTADAGI